jgi:hypothetical protein
MILHKRISSAVVVLACMRNIPILATAAVLAGFATVQIQRAAEHSAQPAEPFTIAILPDTQF